MEYCIHDPEEMLGDILNILDDNNSSYAKVLCEDLQSSILTPAKDGDSIKEDIFLKGFSTTASTAASDSICAPSLDNSVRKNSEEKYSSKQIEETKRKLVKNSIPKDQRFTLMDL